MGGRSPLFLAFWLLGGLLLLFIALPIVELLLAQQPARLLAVAGMADVRAAVALSLEAAATTALLAGLLGTPLGYLLARRSFRGKRWLEALVDLPLAVPHTVAGIALLFAFGRTGPLGRLAALAGVRFWGSFAGVVVAMLFVSVPYMVNAAREAVAAVDPQLEMAARSLGAGPGAAFLEVTLPLAWRGIASGLVLTYARAIAEFGAVIVLAYYPETAPVKIYELFLSGGLADSAAAALLLLAVTLGSFVLLRALVGRALPAGSHPGRRP
ncbi:MAG: ABC transporter permease [Clostridia bacterium]|nr:ABC transporter permease [Clostridia bacterium]MCL6522580.1 ABC transporter permease [Bacillota bacterium]